MPKIVQVEAETPRDLKPKIKIRYISPMPWTVEIRQRVSREVQRLPARVKQSLVALIREIETNGPVRGNWPNYGKLGTTRHHCHLKKGRPTYVAVWEVTDVTIRLVEVIYVGTHEKAPY